MGQGSQQLGFSVPAETLASKDMIATMQENLQAEATKKAYCDKEMGPSSLKALPVPS